MCGSAIRPPHPQTRTQPRQAFSSSPFFVSGAGRGAEDGGGAWSGRGCRVIAWLPAKGVE